jgi:hypothetical protein
MQYFKFLFLSDFRFPMKGHINSQGCVVLESSISCKYGSQVFLLSLNIVVVYINFNVKYNLVSHQIKKLVTF